MLQQNPLSSTVSDALGDPKPKNPTGKSDILGHPTRTRRGDSDTRTRHSKPENPRVFSGLTKLPKKHQNEHKILEILAKIPKKYYQKCKINKKFGKKLLQNLHDIFFLLLLLESTNLRHILLIF